MMFYHTPILAQCELNTCSELKMKRVSWIHAFLAHYQGRDDKATVPEGPAVPWMPHYFPALRCPFHVTAEVFIRIRAMFYGMHLEKLQHKHVCSQNETSTWQFTRIL